MIKIADDLSSGDHVCAIPDSDEHLSELSARFVAGGLRQDEKIFFYDDAGAADAMLRRLAEDGTPFEKPLRTGQIEIVPERNTRAAFRMPIGALSEAVAGTVWAAVEEGYAGARLTGQMHSSVEPGTSATLPEFDGALDSVLGRTPLTALCTYDHAHYTDEQIDIMRALHRDHLALTGAYDDGLMRIVRIGATRARLAGEIDHSNRSKIASLLHSSLDTALRSADASTDIVLDMASVRFMDVATAVSFVHAAEMFPASHSLVLNRVRPRVQRILDRCGAPLASQLRFSDRPPTEAQ
ncbi:MAG: MEDS domain-containing protein [Pseudonocardia sp.]|nr:MEDS domain-containing protein [Pseudonocardia sp.]